MLGGWVGSGSLPQSCVWKTGRGLTWSCGSLVPEAEPRVVFNVIVQLVRCAGADLTPMTLFGTAIADLKTGRVTRCSVDIGIVRAGYLFETKKASMRRLDLLPTPNR